MSQRAGSFYLTKLENIARQLSFKRAVDKNDQIYVHPYTAIRHGAVRQWIKEKVYRFYFKYYRAPTERAGQAHYLMYCRHKGFLVDDNRPESVELYARANKLLPLKIKQEREQRIAFGNWTHRTKMELHPELQNFDPFVPYLAPYLEEMRFMIQEEEELLLYHQFHRRLYRGGWSGTGEKERHSQFLTMVIF